ncbi:secreted phosphoprotein 24 [Polymixia lowei]
MKWPVLVVALLQSLGCSGSPVFNSELSSMADRALGAALTEVNSIYAVNHLYRVTRGSVSRVISVGLNSYDVLMTFSIKETDCLKTSKEDPQRCAFKSGFFVPSTSCSSRVRLSSVASQVVSLRCGPDSSSSSESSEEIFSRGRQQFNIPSVNRDPGLAAPPSMVDPPPPVQSGRSISRQPLEVRPRGDGFNNYLE